MPAIDLRSDTVTLPTPAMRRAMAEAELGDDVYAEDPTVAALERETAELLGKEAALFVPSGTMANQIAIGALTRPGDELICDPTAHVYLWEAGGIARHWGVTPRTIAPAGPYLMAADLEEMIRPDDGHYVRTRLVCLENTLNRRGGKAVPMEVVDGIAAWARANGLMLHLDGARLMNAAVALGLPAAELARPFDTVAICFSKGLGAPVGSAIAGPRDLIKQAHRLRKLLGGGMRQAGVIAAGALYAIRNHVERLAEDHTNAKLLGEVVADTPGLTLESGPPETNLVWFNLDQKLGTAAAFSARMREAGVLVSALGPQTLRACTHLDVSRADTERAGEVLRRVAAC
jgi:threonine aldolase